MDAIAGMFFMYEAQINLLVWYFSLLAKWSAFTAICLTAPVLVVVFLLYVAALQHFKKIE
jgi:hypothetical protein